jgi:hypothetical protein
MQIQVNGACVGLVARAALAEGGGLHITPWLAYKPGDLFGLVVNQTTGGNLNTAGSGFGGPIYLSAEFDVD